MPISEALRAANAGRAAHAADTLARSPYYDHDDTETDLQDFLSDALHWCAANGTDLEDVTRRAYSNYQAEREGDDIAEDSARIDAEQPKREPVPCPKCGADLSADDSCQLHSVEFGYWPAHVEPLSATNADAGLYTSVDAGSTFTTSDTERNENTTCAACGYSFWGDPESAEYGDEEG